MSFEIVVAASEQDGAIGCKGGLPWRLPKEMAAFRTLTRTTSTTGCSNAIVMGRLTYESFPKGPLPDRINVVLTRSNEKTYPENVIVASSLDDAMRILSEIESVDRIFVIGGARIYAEALEHPACSGIYLTSVKNKRFSDADAFFPRIREDAFEIDREYVKSGTVHCECTIEYEYLHYVRKQTSAS
jgi:dihydrofolate reductase